MDYAYKHIIWSICAEPANLISLFALPDDHSFMAAAIDAGFSLFSAAWLTTDSSSVLVIILLLTFLPTLRHTHTELSAAPSLIWLSGKPTICNRETELWTYTQANVKIKRGKLKWRFYQHFWALLAVEINWGTKLLWATFCLLILENYGAGLARESR